jgi:hypothetical protein
VRVSTTHPIPHPGSSLMPCFLTLLTSALKMEAVCSSNMFVSNYKSTQNQNYEEHSGHHTVFYSAVSLVACVDSEEMDAPPFKSG